MDRIIDILEPVGILERKGNIPGVADGITQDSRLIQPGWIFAARKGTRIRGLDFVKQAEDAGAKLVVTDEALPEDLPIPGIRVSDFRKALTLLSNSVYENPSAKLKLVGITGTNGKTTTTLMIRAIFRAAGMECGLMGTIGYDVVSRQIPATLTTPDIDRTAQVLKEMVKAGCKAAVMEVSSHALGQGRVDGMEFAAAGFTNLTQDHLDYHPTMRDYAETKAMLFNRIGDNRHGVINIGDEWGQVMVDACKCRVITFNSKGEADIKVEPVEFNVDGGTFRLTFRGGRAFDIQTSLIGLYHGENIALAAGIAHGFGIEQEAIVQGIASIDFVPGRMESVDNGQPFKVLVDYSHTPDALKNALGTLKPLTTGKLIVVFGCGGDRDRDKRPKMGRIASEMADLVVLTSDNPRTEPKEAIIDEIFEGIDSETRTEITSEAHRRWAIGIAINAAREGDIVLLSGKGHETYQEINGERLPFDDRLIAAHTLENLGWSRRQDREKGE